MSAAHIQAARAALAALRTAWEAIPHALERTAAGRLQAPPHLPPQTREALRRRTAEIARLRGERAGARQPCSPSVHRAQCLVHGITVTAIWNSRIEPKLFYECRGYTASSRREAVRKWLSHRARHYGRYALSRSAWWRWILALGYRRVCTYDSRPTREQIASAIRADRAARPSRLAPDHLGWRAWRWDTRAQCLMSPHQGTPWTSPELRVETWSTQEAVRGEAGVHARRMPRNWRGAQWQEGHLQEGPAPDANLVHGVVERFGRYVLGTTGWRAEWVMIRELLAPSIEIYLALRRVYPEVTVHLSSGVAIAAGECSCA